MKRVVKDVLSRPSGEPVTGRTVSVQLAVPAFADAGQREVLATTYGTTGATGLWQVEVEVNADLDPAGSYYTARVAQGVIHEFVVPPGTGEVWLRDCLVTPPADLPAPFRAIPAGGGAGQVLTVLPDGTLAWSTPTGGAALDVWVPVKTAAYIAAAGESVPCDTTSGTFPVTLPAGTNQAGRRVRVKWRAGPIAPTVAAASGRALDPTWAGFGQVGDCADFSDDGTVWNLI